MNILIALAFLCFGISLGIFLQKRHFRCELERYEREVETSDIGDTGEAWIISAIRDVKDFDSVGITSKDKRS